MVDVSIMIEGQMGLNWARWRRLVSEVERLGFAGLFRSDHFVTPRGPGQDSLELITSLTYLAGNTSRVHFGPLVAPVSFRDPVMLARQAAALQELSDGRFLLGMGAGWMQREHESFGYELLDVPSRLARLEEGFEIARLLLREEPPVSFEGRFFTLRDAVIMPRPAPPPRFLVGGNGMRRTLRLAARYADVWNATFQPPDAFAERCALLDGFLAEEGRKPGDVKRTMMTGVFTGPTYSVVEDRLSHWRNHPAFEGKSISEIADGLRSTGAIVGTADEMAEQLRALGAAGIEELMLQWLWLDDVEGLEALAAAVLG